MLKQLEEFTLKSYRIFLKFLEPHYNFITFSEVKHKIATPYVLIRHDIDASLDAALIMAKIENKMNIKSTFFVLFSHKLYNPLEEDGLHTLLEISKMGHEIGLHYDPKPYITNHCDLNELLEHKIILLEILLNKKIFSFAFHNPWALTNTIELRTKYIDAYNPKLFDLYVSDSCRTWCIEDLMKLLYLKYKRVQLLIHPLLWTKTICTRDSILERFFQMIEKKNNDYKLEWLELWHDARRVKIYDEFKPMSPK